MINTANTTQENRYLDSPYAVKDTGLSEQMPFSSINPLEGGTSFTKESFVADFQKLPDIAQVDKDNLSPKQP